MKKSLNLIISVSISFFILIGSIFAFNGYSYAASPIKKTIKSKSAIVLSNRYEIVKKDYDHFLKDPEYYEETIEEYAGRDFDNYYDSYEEEWVHKPSIKEFFSDLWDCNLNCDWKDVGVKTKTISFSTSSKMCFVIPLSITVDNMYDDEESNEQEIKKGGVRVKLINAKGKVLQNDFISLKGYKKGNTYDDTWLYSDEGILPKGDYKYVFSTNLSDTDFSFKVKYSIIGYTKYSESAKMKKTASAPSGKWIKIGKLGEGVPLLKKEHSSNKSIVPYIETELNGDVYAYCRKKGSSNISITLKNGKKYKTIITVKAGEPNFEAYLTGYNTRNNYFTVDVYNKGASPVTFVRAGSKVIDKDYKKYDRKIKSGKNATVKRGKWQTIRFYVKGSNTWYKYSDFTLYTTIRYEGKKYPCHIWDEDSSYKRNKKWWTTYWIN